MKVLCIHGVGHAEANLDWQASWRHAIAGGLQTAHPGLSLSEDGDIQFSAYDDLFADAVNNLSAGDIARAVVALGGGLLQRAPAFPSIRDEARWTAGMVVVWAENAGVRQQSWQRFLADVDRLNPDVVCAHSLGSLISYDGFRHDEDKINGRIYLTFGSQLGNLFVRGQFGGRLEPFVSAAFWYHLYNPHDHVFTAPLGFDPFSTADNFRQAVTPFGTDWPWPLNHDPVSPDRNDPDKGYLTHRATAAAVWPGIAVATPVEPQPPALARMAATTADVPDAPRRRALLVGINDYPDPANRLEGCINDVFLMSSVLQECGFAAEDIRVVLDDRATAAGIMDRLHWLLDGTAPGDQRFFSYSGHGAQLPGYGVDGKISRIDACLVPYDFAWSAQTAITDDRLVDIYSQLPYQAHFMIVLDSCYSGGMTRGDARIRGLDPPDDIRHRMLRWDRDSQMWVPRDLPPANRNLAEGEAGAKYLGASGAIRPIGRAASLRTLTDARYNELCADLHHKGPFLPVIYEACGEREFASEYRHGVISYGAFTYALVTNLRRNRIAGRIPSFAQLLEETARTLQMHNYNQHPVLVGPRQLLKTQIPWQAASRASTYI